jgi:branched-chain amino acid transport system ATP-binding protein
MSTSPALLTVNHVSGGYGDVQVLHDVSFSIAKNSISCVIGSNGAGKSTLLRTLTGLTKPFNGTIQFADTNIAALSAPAIAALGIAHVPEGRRLFRGMSVRDNLLVGAYLRRDGKQAILQTLKEIYALFPRLAERSTQEATTLSGGEQQMCAIARGLMAKPTLLLIDELSLGLAPHVVDELIDALHLINAAGTTLLLVEQDVGMALEVADFGLVLDQGRILKTGPSQTLLDDPSIMEAYLGNSIAA